MANTACPQDINCTKTPVTWLKGISYLDPHFINIPEAKRMMHNNACILLSDNMTLKIKIKKNKHLIHAIPASTPMAQIHNPYTHLCEDS